MGFTEINPRPRSPSKISASTKEKVYVRSITLRDLDLCEALYKSSVSSHPSRDLLKARLTTSLSLGIFTSPALKSSKASPPTPSADPHDPILLGFVTALISDALPLGAHTEKIPHSQYGETVVLLDVVVGKEWQHKGVGTTLMRDWLQRMKQSGICKRVVARMPKEGMGFVGRFGFREENGETVLDWETQEKEIRMNGGFAPMPGVNIVRNY